MLAEERSEELKEQKCASRLAIRVRVTEQREETVHSRACRPCHWAADGSAEWQANLGCHTLRLQQWHAERRALHGHTPCFRGVHIQTFHQVQTDGDVDHQECVSKGNNVRTKEPRLKEQEEEQFRHEDGSTRRRATQELCDRNTHRGWKTVS